MRGRTRDVAVGTKESRSEQRKRGRNKGSAADVRKTMVARPSNIWYDEAIHPSCLGDLVAATPTLRTMPCSRVRHQAFTNGKSHRPYLLMADVRGVDHHAVHAASNLFFPSHMTTGALE